MSRYKIHFTDNYGTATIECDSKEQRDEVIRNINEDPACENIWEEFYDEEEGWQG